MLDPKNVLSPLDQVRLVESEITRQLTAARVDAEQRIAQARLHTEQRKREAAEQSKQEGQALLKERIALAEEEARVIKAQTSRKSVELKNKGRQRMKEAVQFAVGFVIGLHKQDQDL